MFRKALPNASTRRRALMGAGLLAGLLAGSIASAQSVSNLSLLDRSHDNDNPDNQLYFHLQVANGGSVTGLRTRRLPIH
jgi:hypothetical protein